MWKEAHKTKQPVSRQSILCEREISFDEDVFTNSSAVPRLMPYSFAMI